MEFVWIVLHEDSPVSTVLGVFATEREAEEFSNEVKGQFLRGVIYSRFKVGYRFDRGTGHAAYGPTS
ncbi:hypothetical protein [Sinomonas albida]|uniref:hypothetical protein n=1 Tax=Sinomonas albida TaxID=369942 RepID=UPI001F37D3EB|nr:hypothetical protein [Sinomonas albida]